MHDDHHLVTQAKEGDKKAFGLLYKKYYPLVFRYCKINLKNDATAQDVCQESFVKAYKKIKDFSTDGTWSFQAFIFKIARNLIIDLSRRKKEETLEAFEELASQEDLYSNFDRTDDIKKIQTILARLEECDRQIVILRYFEELPSQEVAKILNIKDGALRVRTYRIMQKIKDLFESTYGKRN